MELLRALSFLAIVLAAMLVLANTAVAQTETTLAPLKQVSSGIPSTDVTCKQGLQLIIKKEDGSPACVRSDTATKLVARGWADSSYLKKLIVVGIVNASSLPKLVLNNTHSAGLPRVGGGNLLPCTSDQYFDNGICKNIANKTG